MQPARPPLQRWAARQRDHCNDDSLECVIVRTSLDLPDDLFRRAKARAVMEGASLRDMPTRYIEGGMPELSQLAGQPEHAACHAEAWSRSHPELDPALAGPLGRGGRPLRRSLPTTAATTPSLRAKALLRRPAPGRPGARRVHAGARPPGRSCGCAAAVPRLETTETACRTTARRQFRSAPPSAKKSKHQKLA